MYGSVARGEADRRSDIDILVDWIDPRKAALYDLQSELERVTGRHVDLHTTSQTFWAIRDRVLEEAVEFL